MDDRFNFQFVTGELIDDVGLDYLPYSFQVLGNNGTHILGGPISSGTGTSTEVLDALIAASDHLPVFADYYHIASHPSDANFDGLVDVADLGILGANWSASQATGNASALVPEPATLSLLAMSVLVVGRRQRG